MLKIIPFFVLGKFQIWDTLKGQLQTEFSDIQLTEEANLFAKPEKRGHLSIDYTCMNWVSFDKKVLHFFELFYHLKCSLKLGG